MSEPADTGMRQYLGADWKVAADTKPDYDSDVPLTTITYVSISGTPVPAATLRRVGWLDQKGRVWLDIPPSVGFDGGSLTPLLIDPREDGH